MMELSSPRDVQVHLLYELPGNQHPPRLGCQVRSSRLSLKNNSPCALLIQ